MDPDKRFLRYYKIASLHPSSEQLILERDNLEKLLASLRSKGDTPVRINCVLGDNKSGKSLVTNLLIEYYNFEGIEGLDNRFNLIIIPTIFFTAFGKEPINLSIRSQ